MSSPGARRVEVGFRFVEVVTFRSPLIPVSAISIMKSGSACVSVASSPKSARLHRREDIEVVVMEKHLVRTQVSPKL